MKFRFRLYAYVPVGLAMVAFSSVYGREWRPGQMPNGNENFCLNCHFLPAGGGPRNAFGQDVEKRVSAGGLEEFWGPELAAMDSDGDGRTNGEELLDPDGTWVSGDPDPGDPLEVTNPGFPPFVRADANGDGGVNIADPIFVLNHLFGGGDGPQCRRSADANADGQVNIADPINILNHLFGGAPPPPAPFPECGEQAGKSASLACEQATCSV